MTFKRDTFWEDHPPVYTGDPYDLGLRISSALELWRVLYVTLASFLTIGVWGLLHIVDPAWSNLIDNPTVIFLWMMGMAWPGMRMVRYRLYDDGSVSPEFGGKPEKLPVLLRKIVNSERLWGRLAFPEAPAYRQSILKGVLPTVAALLPLYLYSGIVVLAVSLIIVLTPQFSSVEAIIALMLLGSFLFPLLPLWWVYRRVRVGVQVLGTGDENEGQDTMACFAEVQAAALHWDRLLGAPYLLLDLHGERIRYYSPVAEPLHLLRVARHRLPHLRLRA